MAARVKGLFYLGARHHENIPISRSRIVPFPSCVRKRRSERCQSCTNERGLLLHESTMPTAKTDKPPNLNFAGGELIFHQDVGRWQARATPPEFSWSEQGGQADGIRTVDARGKSID